MAWFDEFNLPGATIDGHFGFVTADGPDEDDNPDVVLANGWVTFTATTPAARVDGAWLGIQPVRAQIFEGQIVVSEEDPRPVRLLATDASVGVEDWAWKATFEIDGFKLDPLTFKAPSGTMVTLTDGLIPVKSAPYQIVKGEKGEPGDSAYQIAVRNGYDGTETGWLASLKGAKGDTPTWGDLPGKPTSFPSTVSDVQGLADRLAALEYDSGWRVLTSWDGSGTRVGNWTFPSGVAPTPGSSGSVRIRRVGRRVEWLFHGVSWSSSAVRFNSEIPAGFRTGNTEWIAPVAVGLAPTDTGMLRRRTWGFYINDASGKTSHDTYGTHFGYETNEPIPTTLPGTPA